MKTPLTANFKVKQSHNFIQGEYLLKITGEHEISNFYVEEIISTSKLKIRSIMPDGELNTVCETISGNDLKFYSKNIVANNLVKELAYNSNASN